MIRFKALFTGHGENIEPAPGRLVLDTGNHLAPGVIDHHQDSSRPECTATIIFKHPEFVLEHVGGMALADVEIMLHYAPDFDAISSTYLACHLIEHGKLPPGAQQLADYALRVDQATLPRTEHPERSAYGIYTGISRLVDADPALGATGGNLVLERSRRMLDRGLELMEFLSTAASRGRILYDETLLRGEHPFMAEQEAVRNDYSRYLDDLAAGKVYSCWLEYQGGGGGREVDLLIVKDPGAALFKVWARQDGAHAPRGEGFTMLVVQYGDDRFVISVEPRSGFWLRGLGHALDAAETEKRAARGLVRAGPPRPGYTNSDPWYDGRSAIHNYTIVDAPRSGTFLSYSEVMAIVMQPELWAAQVEAGGIADDLP